MYLLPKPSWLLIKEESIQLKWQTGIALDAAIPSQQLPGARLAAELLQQELEELLGRKPTVNRETAEAWKKNHDKNAVENGEEIFLQYAPDSFTNKEAYLLKISPEGIVIMAGTSAGFLYGVQTLRQIIRQSGAKIPCLLIDDVPAIARRGLSYDVTRGRIPTLEELKRQADLCCFYKMNELQLYVEHSYMFRDFSEVWRDSDPLTAEEILELDAYCKVRNIDLVPSLASFGHLYEVLVTQSYRHLCEIEIPEQEPFSMIGRMAHHTVDVSNEESFRMVADRIREYAALFTSDYFNICADETFDLCTGKSRKLGEEKGVRRVYLEFLKQLCKVVEDQGKIPMFWGDVLLEEPELLKEMPEKSIILNWEYAPEVTEDKTKILWEAGVKNMYLCPGVQSWNHFINRHSDAYRNILGMCRNAHKYQVTGVLVTEWGDLGHMTHPEFSSIGQIYSACFSWSNSEMSEDEINRAISLIQYGDRTERLVGLFRALADTECVRWWNLVNYKENAARNPEEIRLEYALEIENYFTKMLAQNQVTEELYDCLKELPISSRKVVSAYLLLGEGQRLFAEGLYYLTGIANRGDGEGEVKGDIKGDVKGQTLACALERWFTEYRKLWRSCAKESELQRLSEVVFWFADSLRTA